MKVIISSRELLDAVNKVKTVVAAKSALPILSHILMETGNACLRLTATDLKVSIECVVDCQVDEPGSLTVSSQRLSSILAELPDREMTLVLGDNSVIYLNCGKIETRLFSMSPEEFPPVRSFEGIEPLVLSQQTLKKIFSKTSFAICSDQARYNLTGLLFEIQGGNLTVVATDGRRMSLYVEREGIPSGISMKVIIPGKMISELERLLSDDDDVEVFIDEAQAAFSFRNIRLITALIEGTFPNYEMVIPKKHDKEAVLKTTTFIEGVRRTRTMTNDKFNSVRFGLSKGTMSLKVVTPEVGEYNEEMDAEYEGEKVEIAFNPDFVLDVLRRVESDQVSLLLKDGMSPGLLKPTNDTGVDNYVNVIMPIRI
ncbi:MAG TPA: DNA polymerase III subunit beta [Candidatus Hydrogenedentes bacterium]|nr:DNA polymerase III subunit beta [Candidatus Hydrogenedentota bacterium]HOS02367.1 DNA polymerase III subunit beta [Candidatus Hydrogenedentota bacterium]